MAMGGRLTEDVMAGVIIDMELDSELTPGQRDYMSELEAVKVNLERRMLQV